MIAAILIVASTLTPTPATSMDWVCSTLDDNQTADGMWDVVAEAAKRGMLTESDGESVAKQIVGSCPEYIPIAKEWAEANG
jgi:hypothetical protein